MISRKSCVLLLLNKSDLGDALPSDEFLSLGIKPSETFRTSATTRQGIRELKDALVGVADNGFVGSIPRFSSPETYIPDDAEKVAL